MAEKTYQTTLLIRGDSKDAVRSVQLTRDQLEKLTGVQQKNISMTSQMSGAYKAMGVGLGAIGGVAAFALYKLAKETSDSDAAMAQLNATLKSTGGAAGKSAADLSATADSLQKVTAYSDDSIIAMDAVLATFTKIKGDNFDRATRSVLDLSTALHKDLQSSAILVGKALNDPIKGIDALSKAGVSFTNDQKETIKALVEMGDTAGAQVLILKELETEFGGSAEAARNELGGAIDSLKNSFDNLFEISSADSAPITASINELNAAISSPEFKAATESLVKSLIDVSVYAAKALPVVVQLFQAVSEKSDSGMVDVITRLSLAMAHLRTDAVGLEILRNQIEATKGELSGLASSGETSGIKVESLNARLATLEKRLSNSVTYIASTTKGTKSYTDSMVDATITSNKFNVTAEKYSIIVNKGTVATKGATAATKDNTNVHLISEAAQKKAAAAADKLAAAHKKVQDRLNAATKSIAATSDELTAMNKKTEEYIKSLKFETEQIGKSAKQQEIDNAVREAGTRITEKQKEAIIAAAGAHYEAARAAEASAKATEEAARQSEQMWSHLTDSMSDIFTALVTGGDKSQGVFDTIGDGFSAMVKKMVAEAASNEVVIAFGGTTAGGQNSANSSFSSRIEQAGWMYAISKGISSILGAFNGSSEDQKNADPLQKVLHDSGQWAWNKSVGLFTGKTFDDYFGQQNDGNNTGAASFNASTGSISSAGVGKSFDSGNVDFASQLSSQLIEFAKAIGGSSAKGNIDVSSQLGIKYNGTTYGKDVEAFYKEAFKDVINASTTLKEGLKPLLLAFNGTAQSMAEFTTAIVNIDKLAGFNSVSDAIKDFKAQSVDLTTSYYTQSDSLREMIANFDGSEKAATNLATALAANKTAAYDFAMAIQAIGQSITQSAQAQAASIRESVMTEEELRNARTTERNALKASLATLVDPAEIQRVTDRILSLNRAIFDSLPDAEKLKQADVYANYDETIGKIANNVLTDALNVLQKTQTDINNQVAVMLGTASQAQQTAANTQIAASQRFADYVDRLIKYGIPVSVNLKSGSEVNR